MVLKTLLLLLIPFSLLSAKQRETSYPYLAGDTWRFFCDWKLGAQESFDPEKVALGDTVFVEYDSLKEFSTRYLPQIHYPFILITPNCENGSDSPLPGDFAFLLESEKIAAWFLQNLDRQPDRKIVPIPIGLANRIWEHGDTNQLNQMIPVARAGQDKKFLAYINFAVNTNRKERGECLKHFRSQNFATFTGAKPFGQYLRDLSRTLFVISPPGNGQDCHRTWEALLMGCYPVVKSSTLNPLYEGLPVVIVNDWSEVTEEFLEKKYLELSAKNWCLDKIYAPYWLKKARDIQLEIRKK